MSSRQTENSYFNLKVSLRINHLPEKKNIKVLDCFSADGKIWDFIKNKSNKEIHVLRLEKENKKGIYLKGDNIKFLKTINISEFDVIDLDAFGIPFKQLDILFSKGIKDKIIYITFIQSMFGKIPEKLLFELGYTKNMINKIPTLFNKNGFEKFKGYLAKNGIKSMFYHNVKNKFYCCICGK